MLKFKQFQREDYARAALYDGDILGQEQGLGKTLAAYTVPLLKVGLLHRNGVPVRPVCPAEPVLIVAQGDLHRHIIDDGLRHFKTRPTIIDSQQTFLRLSTLNPVSARRELPPRYYLTTYTDLSRNDIIPFPKLDRTNPESTMRALHLQKSELAAFFDSRTERCDNLYSMLGVTPLHTAAEVRAAWFRLRKRTREFLWKELDEAYHIVAAYAPPRRPAGDSVSLSDLSPEQVKSITAHYVAWAHSNLSMGLGTSRYYEETGNRIRCVWSASLADLCQDAFAAVVLDEGTKIKGEDTLIGAGTRQLNPRYRLVMTGTPIKNRLPDFFRLAHWATGGHEDAHPRFPYGNDDREDFTVQFSVSERNLSREERDGRRFVKLTPQVCNIHNLWKLVAPVLLRRRKQDCGEDIVKMLRHVIRVPMGTLQASVYKYYLDAEYRDCKGKPAIGAKLQDLRIASANPASTLLDRPASDRKTVWVPPYKLSTHNSQLSTASAPRGTAYIPKLACALNLIHDILARGEQFIAFSAFLDSTDALSARLNEAGVRHLTLDGRTSQQRRGELAAQFKRGPLSGIPGTLAGIEAMSEGHSFSLCRNVIIMCYTWALDKMLQAIARVWRLDSPEDVNLYAIICDGTVERKLEANIHEKKDAAELVLDGHLLGEDPEELSLFELLQMAEQEFATGASGTIDERLLERDWPQLRSKLATAHTAWQRQMAKPSNIIPLRTSAKSITPADAPFQDLPLWRQTFRRCAGAGQ